MSVLLHQYPPLFLSLLPSFLLPFLFSSQLYSSLHTTFLIRFLLHVLNSSRPVDDGNVKEAAKFAVDNEYTKVGGYNSYVIKDAQQQVGKYTHCFIHTSFVFTPLHFTQLNCFLVSDISVKVVAGLNYKMNIDTTLVSGLCESAEFIVYNHFGKLSVTDKKLNPSGCQK